jgi:hypothetical protein
LAISAASGVGGGSFPAPWSISSRALIEILRQ